MFLLIERNGESMLRIVFLIGALIATVYGIVLRDAVMTAFMGGSFGFQFALWLVDREQAKRLHEAEKCG